MNLFESDVIEMVCRYLADRGFSIDQKLTGSEHGDDIIATIDSLTLYIEAKGSTSSRRSSSRYGKPFSRSQAHDHVAMALYKAAEVLTREADRQDVHVGIALPKNEDHVELAHRTWRAIVRLGLVVFWVDSEGNVTIEGNTADLGSPQ